MVVVLRAEDGEEKSAPWQIARVVLVVCRLPGDVVGVAEVSSGVAVPRARLSTARRGDDSHSDEGAHEGKIKQNPEPAKLTRTGAAVLLKAGKQRGD